MKRQHSKRKRFLCKCNKSFNLRGLDRQLWFFANVIGWIYVTWCKCSGWLRKLLRYFCLLFSHPLNVEVLARSDINCINVSWRRTSPTVKTIPGNKDLHMAAKKTKKQTKTKKANFQNKRTNIFFLQMLRLYQCVFFRSTQLKVSFACQKWQYCEHLIYAATFHS